MQLYILLYKLSALIFLLLFVMNDFIYPGSFVDWHTHSYYHFIIFRFRIIAFLLRRVIIVFAPLVNNDDARSCWPTATRITPIRYIRTLRPLNAVVWSVHRITRVVRIYKRTPDVIGKTQLPCDSLKCTAGRRTYHTINHIFSVILKWTICKYLVTYVVAYR